jgi:hypothetical protein
MVIFAKDFGGMIFPVGSAARYMGFLFAALDESRDRKGEHIFVVAGWVSRQKEWQDIESKWMRRLEREDDPEPMKYYSEKEFRALNGQFERFRKYPAPKGREAARRIRDDLSDILCKSKVAGFGLGVLLKDYRDIRKSVRARKVLLPDPYIQAYQQIMILVAAKVKEQLPNDWVAFLCDEHNKFTDIKAIYDELKNVNPVCGSCMGSVNYMEDEQSPALQAADLLAAVCKDDFLERITTPEKTTARDV